jgi:uncharacterized protein
MERHGIMTTHLIHPGRLRSVRQAGLRAPWWREYDKSHSPFQAITRDGVELRGVYLHANASAGRPRTLLIYCHGFLSGKNYAAVKHWVELLADELDIITFDFRGHGESGGATTLGDREGLDLAAIVRYARQFSYDRLVVMGSSMGGAVVIRYAAETAEVDGVITMGAFAHERFSVYAMSGMGLLQLPFSKQVLRRAYATRVEKTRFSFAPRDYVGRISPRPLLLLHGEFDRLVPTSHARELYNQAGEPKRLDILRRGGHDLENLNARTRARIMEWLKGLGYV